MTSLNLNTQNISLWASTLSMKYLPLIQKCFHWLFCSIGEQSCHYSQTDQISLVYAKARKTVMTSSNDVITWIFFEILGKNFFPPKLIPVVKWSKSDMPMLPFQDVALSDTQRQNRLAKLLFLPQNKDQWLKIPPFPLIQCWFPKFSNLFHAYASHISTLKKGERGNLNKVW